MPGGSILVKNTFAHRPVNHRNRLAEQLLCLSRILALEGEPQFADLIAQPGPQGASAGCPLGGLSDALQDRFLSLLDLCRTGRLGHHSLRYKFKAQNDSPVRSGLSTG